jgi:transposase, IS30 family
VPAAFDAAVKREVFRRLRAGESPGQAAAAVGVSDKLVRKWRARVGGVIPEPVRDNPRYLGRDERYEIARLREVGASVREIARQVERAPSTVSRELRRHGTAAGRDQPERAHSRAVAARRRPQPTKLQRHPRLAEQVQSMLDDRLSPQEVAGRLPLLFADDESMRISHEAIYQAIYIRGRGELRRVLKADLRSRRTVRRRQGSSRAGIGGAIAADAPSIHDRPADIEDRLVPGHWEGDLVIGAGGRSAVGTLVERVSGYVCLLHLPDSHGTTAVIDALIAAVDDGVHGIPAGLIRTLTWDRGYEMAGHARFSAVTGVAVYFADPYSPWQRGSNENTNGLLREYIPKGSDLSTVTADQLTAIADQLNRRPRKRHKYLTPAEVLNNLLNEAGVATTS